MHYNESCGESVQMGIEPRRIAEAMALGDASQCQFFQESLFSYKRFVLIGLEVMLEDWRFGFVILRYQGDLRKVIDLRVEHNNQALLFTHGRALWIILEVAIGMRRLQR